ncbi:Ctr copper transporter [Microdochium trichocladiopsis]|uniref:Copper transport protein n=1 Tax=Microdochium trichocladiopsis TaxID=1682393 RepID=A0A9P8Y791_9PEZI|nr:Ctr copper transporter [Microdochium trichocladiopsis]KAH7031435.1 Ctr copper transporter [Microdochium trichocladiopsis]
MNMLLNYSTKDLCIFSHHFHIPGDSWALWAAGLLFVFLFCAGYEGFKNWARAYDRRVAAEYLRILAAEEDEEESTTATPSTSSSSSSSGLEMKKKKTSYSSAPTQRRTVTTNATSAPSSPPPSPQTTRAAAASFARARKPTRALLYAAQYLYGMLAMLLFMTYNVQVMLACSAGVGAGFLRWAADLPPLGGAATARRRDVSDVGEQEEEEQQSAACH